MLSEKYLNVFQRIVVAGCLLFSGTGSFAQTSPYTVERLSLFIHDGVSIYEDRRDRIQLTRLPAGVTVDFTAATNGGGEPVWQWTFTNTNAVALDNLKITGFVDADLSVPDNTFFNEHGELLALSAPAGAIAPVRWEIGEPGYHHGDLLPRAATGALNNASHHDSATPDDVAMALSADIGTLRVGQTLTVTAALSASGYEGLQQQDGMDDTVRIFTLYARKGEMAGLSSSDYAIIKTTDTPNVKEGDAIGYTLQVTNHGPDDGGEVRIMDALPTGLKGAVWHCASADGATCGIAGGAGQNMNLSARIPVGGSVRIDISGYAAAVGDMINTASVTPADGDTADPDTGNNSSSVVITVTERSGGGGATADLSLIKTTTTPVIRVNDRVAYRLEVSNAGPDKVSGALIRDDVPAAIENVTWTCSASHGAACASSGGSGNAVSAGGELPAGGKLVLLVEGIAKATGTHTNSASVSGSTDSNPVNNESRVDVEIHTGAGGGSVGRLETTGAFLREGEMWIWGYRERGLQGNGVLNVASNMPPAKVRNLPFIIQYATGDRHIIALDENGDVWGWGENDDYETGCAQNGNRDVATPCKVMSHVVQVAAGEEHSMALDEQGRVWSWGENNNKALGRGNSPDKLPMTVNLNGETARLIGTGHESSFAVTTQGHVWAWGENSHRGLGVDVLTSSFNQPVRVANLDVYAARITHITGGEKWGAALLDDGTVISWGQGDRIGVGTTSSSGIAAPREIASDVAQLFATTYGGVILKQDGSLYTWGEKHSSFEMLYGASPTLRATAGVPVEIGGGDKYILYRTEDGALYGVGENDKYKLDQNKCCKPHINWPGSEIRLQ